MKAFKKIGLLLLAMVLVFLAAPSVSHADDSSSYYDGYYGTNYYTITVTNSKGKALALYDYVKSGTELTATVAVNSGYEWDDSEDAEAPVFYVQGNSYTLDKNNSFKFTVNSDWSDWFYIDTDTIPKELPHFEYTHGLGYTLTAKDSKGKTVNEGDLLKDGQVITVTAKLDEGFEWTTDTPYFYAQDNYFELDKKGSFKFTYDSNITTVAYIYTYNDPQHIYTAEITADEHVKSFVFADSPNKKKAAASGNGEYILDRAHGLSGETIAIKCILEDGYELDSVKVTKKAKRNSDNKKVNIGYAFTGCFSDPNLFTIYPLYGFDSYSMTVSDYAFSVSITTKKASDSDTAITLDKKKYNVATPKIKGKLNLQYGYYYDSDYYRGTKTLTFGKGKKASTVFSIEMERYGKKGEVYTWLDYDKAVKFGTDAVNYEIFDLTGVKDVDRYTMTSLINEIYSEYKKGRLPALKAIFLPSDMSVEIKYTFNTDSEYYYYPVQVITAD